MVSEIYWTSARALRTALHGFTFIITVLIIAAPTPGRAQSALGDNWSTADIGSPGIAGKTTYQSCGTSCANFSIVAGGTDIGGTSDQFRYAYRPLNGDGTVILQVGTLGATNSQSKAGIMIRESLDAGSRHGFVTVTAGAGVTYSHRLSTNGTTTAVGTIAGAAPQWLKLERLGTLVRSYKSADGGNWTLVASDTLSLPRTVWIGAAVTSHDAYLSTTASIAKAIAMTSLPSPWSSKDLGTPSAPGAIEFWNSVFTVYGSGSGLGATSDQFRFTYRQASGDGDLIVRLASLAMVNTGTAAGVMIRESLATNAAHETLLISSGNGVQFHRRLLTGVSTITTSLPGTLPGWVRIRRRGDLLTASYKTDNGVWTTIGQESIPMPSTFYVGMAATSHDTSRTSRTDFDTTALVPSAWIPAGTVVPPTIQLVAPAASWTLMLGQSLNIAANAADTDGVLSGVDFYVNGKLVATDATAPYAAAWTPAATGTYSITAVARDDGGATATSATSTGTVVAVTQSLLMFTASADDVTNVWYYYLRLYPSTASLSTSPVATLSLGKPAVVNGECSVDITTTMKGLASGSYVAVVSAVGLGGETLSLPSAPFTN